MKNFCHPLRRTGKGNTQDFPSQKVIQNMILQGYVLCYMLLSSNLKQIFDPHDSHTAS